MKTMRELYEEWIKALLSGKYKQGRNILRGEDGYCCLGVVCDLNQEDKMAWKRTSPTDRYFTFGGNASVPPNAIKDKLGLTGGHIRQLTDMNDLEHRSFRGIAAYIEQKIMPEVLAMQRTLIQG